ncbi:MAG TPA: 3-phosphoshikimate 1-carboxyvinyltransferase [Pirellulales bacterium]|jgi:3-phosphoshikimate 1-carboxyvinyltransferase|nr:3-phosphoshikimate 1-carboxyvinyltransferase [Pirellulales bacterium]
MIGWGHAAILGSSSAIYNTAMVESLEITPAAGPVRGSIRPPGSKSITNRALICAALAEGESILAGALPSEDTQVMIESLRRLGIAVNATDGGQTPHLTGCGGKIPAAGADLYIANSGTSVRFLTALSSLGQGRFRLDGTARMRERPIADLLEGLAQLGVNLNSELGNGCPPVVVHAASLAGGRAKIRGDISSQFLSGLLLVAPYAQHGVELSIEGELVSQPYIRLTLAVMRSFGVDVPGENLRQFHIVPGKYRGQNYAIEPDASAASYFFAAAAITGGEAIVQGLSQQSLQGDVAFVECLERMGCSVREQEVGSREQGAGGIVMTGPGKGKKLHGISVNMNAISDTVQTLAAVALFADGPTTITGVAHIRHKETDRIGNLALELRKFGATVDELPDGLRIAPPAKPQAARIATYNDHRMAMSLALVGLKVPGVVIENPGCTGKTYPGFFDDLAKLVTGRG